MPAKAGSAYVDFHGDFSALQKEVTAQLAPLTGRFGKLGKAAGVGMAGVAIAAVGAGKALYDVGSQFDKASDTIIQKTGATGKELDKLKSDFKAVVSSVPTDFGTAADAIGDLHARLGITGKPLQQLSKQFLELSRMTGTDLEDNIQNVSRAFKDSGVSTGKQSAAFDRLFRVSQATGVNMSDLTNLMVRFGSPLRQLGFDFNTSAAMFAKFEAEGVNVQTAMPGLRMALKNFALAGKDPAKALKATFDQIKHAPSDVKAAGIAFDVFGTRAGPDMAAAVREGRFNYQDLINTMKAGDSTILGTAQKTNDFAENWTIFTNKLKVLVEPVATAVFNTINRGMTALTRLNLTPAINSLKQFWAQAGAVRTVFGVLGNIAGDAIAGIKQNLQGLAQVFRGVIQVISGILTGHFGRAWDGVKNIFSGAVKAVLGILRTMISPITGIANTIGQKFSGAFDTVIGAARSVASKLAGVFRSVISAAGGLASSIGTAIRTWVNANTLFGDHVHIGLPGPAPDINFDIPALALGGKVTAPMVMVGEEAPRHHEYVIASNPAYRDRNRGLWAAAGHDLGIPGFARGGITSGGMAPAWMTNFERIWKEDAPFFGARGKGMPNVQAVPAGSGYTTTGAMGDLAGAPLVIDLSPNARKAVGSDPSSWRKSGIRFALEHELGRYFGGAGQFMDPGGNAGAGNANWVANQLASYRNTGKGNPTGAFKQRLANWGQVPSQILYPVNPVAAYGQGGVLQNINHSFPRGGHQQLAPWVWAALGEHFGLPGWTWSQITHGESNYQPGADGGMAGTPGPAGYGGGQMTPDAAGPRAVAAWAHIAGKSAGQMSGPDSSYFNPVTNTEMGAWLWKAGGPGNWKGTRYVTDWNKHYTGKAYHDHKDTKGKGTSKAKGLGLSPALQAQISKFSGLSDLYEEYASRANTLEGMVFGNDESAWLQQELTALTKLRNLLVRAVARLQQELGALGKIPGKAAAPGATKGGVDPKVAAMDAFGLAIDKKNFPYVYGGGHASFSGPYDCSGFVSAILHAGGLTNTPMSTDPLKTWGHAGPGDQVTIGVRGSSGRAAHTMMRVGSDFFESGGGHGAAKVSGWDGGFPIKRHPPGLAKGGIVSQAVKKILGVGLEDIQPMLDPRSPNFVGWGLRKGGRIPGYKKGKGPKSNGSLSRDAFKKHRDALTSKLGTVTSALTDVQGAGGPMSVLRSLPPTGELGGRIFDVQSQLLQVGANASASDSQSESSDLLRQLLQQSQTALAVSQAQYPILSSIPGLLPYAGSFGGGGVIDAPFGAARSAIVHGGEAVFTPDQMDALGSPFGVTVVVEDGAVDPNKIAVVVGETMNQEQSRARRRI